jgi:RHS repeat-associated protein
LSVAKTLAVSATSLLYDEVNVVQESLGGTPTSNRLLGPGIDENFLTVDATGTRVPLSDALGSTVAVTDSNGNLSAWYAYEPFGRTTVNGSTGTDIYQFTGRDNDGTGLYYLRSRYYDPSSGRFISADPIGFGGGPNVYAYAEGDPINLRDPLGHTVRTNWTFFWDWVFERGDDNERSYGEGTVEVGEMRSSPGAASMRRAFRAANCQPVHNGPFGTIEAFFKTAWRVNSTAAQVGGFVYDAIDNGDGTVTYTIHNKAGAYSFFLHIPLIPKKLPRGGTVHIFGDIDQKFEWSEKSPCCQGR